MFLATSASSELQNRVPSSIDATEITLDAEGLLVDFRELPAKGGEATPKRHVEIIDDAGSDTSETLRLLRTRLTAVTLALAIGFFIFSIWLTLGSIFSVVPMTAPWLVAQFLVTVVLFGAWFWLHRTPDLSAPCGRSIEILIFAVPAIYFSALTAKQFIESATLGHVSPVSLHGWMILIFAHAIFIPNPWRRAATVSLTIASLPILTAVVTSLVHLKVQDELLHHPSWFIDMILGLAATCTVAIIGVRTILSMRAEVLEAKQMGRYKLREKIGAGGMGEVYLAEHQMLKRPCAIKIIRPERAGDPKTMARFEREVQATAKLSHWNSVYIYDYGNTSDGTLYYVMEYLPGLTLQELVSKVGPLPPGRTIFLLRQICSALREAHALQLLHRDVKPANLFVSERGGRFDVIKLLDFGLVKPIQVVTDLDLTQQGGLTGSPLYMSPEQALGEEVIDQRSDIYSLGAVAYFMLTGNPPFPKGQGLRVILQHVHEPPPPMVNSMDSRATWAIPEDLEAIVMRCLAKKPTDRFPNVEELDAALASCINKRDWNSSKAEAWWKHHCPKLRDPNRPASFPCSESFRQSTC